MQHTEFEAALAAYRVSLEAVMAEATTTTQQRLCMLHRVGLRAIERCYAATNEPQSCRALIESEKILHRVDILTGAAVPSMRAAFEQLLQSVSVSQLGTVR